jgi:nitrate/nitrite transport system substrate-binding protein
MGFDKLSRREFVKSGSLLTAGLAGSMVFPQAMVNKVYAGVGQKIKIGVIAPSHCALPMVHAKLTGTFQKNGVDAEIHYMPTASSVAMAMIDGKIDVGQLITPVFYAVSLALGPFAKLKTPLVSAQVAGSNGGVLVVGWNSPIRKPEQLKGKIVGVHSPFMVHNLLFNELLSQHGVNPKKDIKLKIIKMNKLIPALEKEKIDAFINPEPLGTFALERGAGKELLTTKKLWKKHPCCLVAMRKDFFEKKPDLAKSIYLSTLNSGSRLNSLITRVDAIVETHEHSAPYSKVPLESMIKAFVPGRSGFDPFPFQSSAKVVLKMMKKNSLLPDNVKIEPIIKETFLSDFSREILSSMPGAKIPASNYRKEKVVGKIMS